VSNNVCAMPFKELSEAHWEWLL